MRRKSLGTALATLLIALAGADPAAGASRTIIFVSTPRCLPGLTLPPFEAALGTLRDAAGSPVACGTTASCARAASEIADAFETACEAEENALDALAQTARAARSLEADARRMATGPLLAALQGVLAASEDLVAEAEGASEEALDGLCSSARQSVRRTLERAESGFDQARLDGARGAWSNSLSRLGRAAGEFRSVVSNAATAATRCRPRACRANDAFHFERGRLGNPELRLVPPDRGTLAVYRVSASDGPSFSTSGSLRLAFDGLTRARVASRLTSAGRTLDFQGTFSTSACLDGNGWYRLASITESLRASNGARGGGVLRLTPAGVAVPPPGLVPVVPQAVAMRVGDRILESGVGISASAARGAPPFRCSGEHRVVAIEELRVAAGTFSAARVESFMTCPGGPALDWISWLASGIGFARVELRDADTYAEFELTCFETPETPGACAAASVSAPSLGGSGVVLHGGSSAEFHAMEARTLFQTLPPLPLVTLEAGPEPGAAPE